VGLVGAAGLLAQRRWGRVVAIVALALGLAVSLAYGIVWLVMVPDARALTAWALALLWLAQLLALLHWSIPRRP
jgi:biotin transporter BioY